MSKDAGKSAVSGVQQPIQARPLQPHVDDSYAMRGKPPEPAVCPECGVVFHKGRWQWLAKPAGAHDVLCPACHRTRDGIAAGYLKLEGAFFASHRDEILRLLRSVEKREIADHPLQRIMNIEETEGGELVTTTGVHLARAVAEAIHHAYQGHLAFRYGDGEQTIHATWKR